MPVDLSIKKVPDELARKLRERAERNHRSLQGELMVILRDAVEGAPYGLPASGAWIVRERADKDVTRQPAIPARSESALIVRRFRDGRTLTPRQVYEEVIALGGLSPDDATDLIRRGRHAQ